MHNPITLSSNEFKALASETRAQIIKLLHERNHTLTELSRKLDMAAPTIKQHLGVLQGAALVQELDEGRKWKYYTLTRKGKNIFSTEPSANILIVLGTSIIALCGLLYGFLSLLGTQAVYSTRTVLADSTPAAIGTIPASLPEKVVPAAGEAGTKAVVVVQTSPLLSMETLLLLAAIVLVALLVGFFAGKLKR